MCKIDVSTNVKSRESANCADVSGEFFNKLHKNRRYCNLERVYMCVCVRKLQNINKKAMRVKSNCVEISRFINELITDRNNEPLYIFDFKSGNYVFLQL